MSKFTKPEKSWILYDVANSAFTMLISTTIPIFFRSLAAKCGADDQCRDRYLCGDRTRQDAYRFYKKDR